MIVKLDLSFLDTQTIFCLFVLTDRTSGHSECFILRATLEALWCVKGLQEGSSWLEWLAGVSAVPRSTSLGFIPALPGSATGFWAILIPAWSMSTRSMSPLISFSWHKKALTLCLYQDLQPTVWWLLFHRLVTLRWKLPSLVEVVQFIRFHRHNFLSSSNKLLWKLPV